MVSKRRVVINAASVGFNAGRVGLHASRVKTLKRSGMGIAAIVRLGGDAPRVVQHALSSVLPEVLFRVF